MIAACSYDVLGVVSAVVCLVMFISRWYLRGASWQLYRAELTKCVHFRAGFASGPNDGLLEATWMQEARRKRPQ